jgi:tetratricopeptide (TPR) repeat protein
MGDYDASSAYLEESLVLAREMHDKWGMGFALQFLGLIAAERGELAAARAMLEESLALRRELGDKQGTGISLKNLGEVARRQGSYAEALRLYQEGLAMVWDLKDLHSTADALEKLASLGAADEAEGQPRESTPVSAEKAARLFGAAEALREAIGAPRPPSIRVHYEMSLTAVRTQLGAEGFARAFTKGRALSVEQAVEEGTAET